VVLDRSVDCAGSDDGDAVRALVHLGLARVSPRHPRVGRQTVAAAGQPCRRAVGRRVRGTGMDRVRDPGAEAALERHGNRADRWRLVERLAPAAASVVDSRGSRRTPGVNLLDCHYCGRLRWVPDGVQGSDGLGLRPYSQPLPGDAHARQHHDQPAGAQSFGHLRDASPGLFICARRSLLDRRRRRHDHSRFTRVGSLSSRKPTNFECRR
jgi:hypothetical protein